MTNFEWLKKRINEMSVEELGTVWQNEEAPWCAGSCAEDTCVKCIVKWGV